MRRAPFVRGLFPVLLAVALPSACQARTEGPEYRTVKSTDYGKSLLAERTDAKTLQAALQLTLSDITRYFGAAPSVFKAFADSKDAHAGGATFVVKAKEGQVKGLVTAQVGEASTRVAVAYVRMDAPAAEWGKLVQRAEAKGSPPPEARAAGPEAKDTAAASESGVAHVPLRTYSFPDGTGSIGLADGWTTDAKSATGASLLKGPNDASVAMGGLYAVQLPSSPLARGPQTLVAQAGTPAEVFQAVVPQFSQMSIRQGGPSFALEHVSKVSEERPFVPGGRRWVLRYGMTETSSAGAHKHFLAMAWVEVNPVRRGAFMLSLLSLRAPDASFERMRPVMFAMLNSVRTNDAAIRQKSANHVAAQKQWFNNQQQALRETQAANDAQHKKYYADQRERARSNDNFDEYLRGVRTVEDTQTGVKTSVDLGNVDKVVDALNVGDPGRYREIPLRDEAHP